MLSTKRPKGLFFRSRKTVWHPPDHGHILERHGESSELVAAASFDDLGLRQSLGCEEQHAVRRYSVSALKARPQGQLSFPSRFSAGLKE